MTIAVHLPPWFWPVIAAFVVGVAVGAFSVIHILFRDTAGEVG